MRAQTERLRLEYRDSVARARELIASCTTRSLQAKPDDGGWCAAQCIDHLNLTNEEYVRRIRYALDEATVRPPRREERLSLLGRFFVRGYEPPVRRRFSSDSPFVPTATPARTDLLVGRFEQTHLQLIRLLEETDAIDRTKIKVPFAESDWIRLSLFDTLSLLAAHDRRHLAQAERAARV